MAESLNESQRILKNMGQTQENSEPHAAVSFLADHGGEVALDITAAAAVVQLAKCHNPSLLLAMVAGTAASEVTRAIADYFELDKKIVNLLVSHTSLVEIPDPSPVPVVMGNVIAHRKSRLGMYLAIGLSAVAGVAVGALVTAATGGLGGPLVATIISTTIIAVSGAVAGGIVSGIAGSLAKALAQLGEICGKVESGSPNVFFQGQPVARVSDTVSCTKCGNKSRIAQGSLYVSVNELPLARIAHHCECGAVLAKGVSGIIADQSTGTYAHFEPEISVNEMALLNGVAIVLSLVVLKTAVCGDPVDMIAGNYVDERTDFTYKSILPLELKRIYTGTKEAFGLTGRKWFCNWSQCIWFAEAQHEAIFLDGNGYSIRFSLGGETYDTTQPQYPHYHFSGTRDRVSIFNRQTQQTLFFTQSPINDRLCILTGIEDRNGNRIDYIYDKEGYLTRITHSDGVAFSVECNRKGYIRQLVLEDDNTQLVHYSYDDKGRLLSVHPRFTNTFHYSYNEQGWLNHWHDTGATQCDIDYDEHGRVIATRTPQGLYNDKFLYFPEENKSQYIDATGACETFFYDEHNLLIQEEDALGRITRFEWDEWKRKTATIDALGRKTQYSYHATGGLKEIIDHTGRKICHAYDDYGQLTQTIYPDGSQASYAYDERGNLVEETDIDGGISRYAYDGTGRVIKTIDATGAEEQFQYDETGRLKRVTDAVDNTIWLSFDTWGRLLHYTDAENHTTSYDYELSPANPHGGLSRIIHPDNGVETFRYDREGLLIYHQHGDSEQTRRVYGAFDLLDSTIDGEGKTTRLRYDGATRLSTITNAAGQTWRLIYDKAGQLISEQDFAGRVTRYSYDAVGRMTGKARPDGEQHRLEWDERDRLTAILTPAQAIRYAYDDKDQLIQATTERNGEEETRLSFYYDKLGRLSKEIQNGAEVDYIYDEAGRCINRQTTTGETTFRYDPRGLLSEYLSNGRGFSFQYNRNGMETGRETGNRGFNQTSGYDSCGRLSWQTVKNAAAASQPMAQAELSRGYLWDKSGRLSSVNDSFRGETIYRYSQRNQVTLAWNIPKGHEATRAPINAPGDTQRQQYSYDALMNLTHSEGGRHQYSPHGEVLKIGNSTYHYDELGRVTTRTIEENGFRPKTWHFTWDSFDRLLSARTPGGSLWRYTYDAFGRRLSKECVTVGKEQKTTFLWEGVRLAEEATSSTQIRWHYEQNSFAPTAKELIAADGTHGFFPVTTDHLGTPKELYDERGTCQWMAQTTLWGRTQRYIAHELKTELSAYDCNLRFQGQYEDAETGLYYNLHRYYDPVAAMYFSPDPIGLEGGLRPQGYVHNPLTWIDPIGLAGCPKIEAENEQKPDQPTKNTVNRSANFKSEGHARNFAREQVGKDPIQYEPGKLRSQNGKWQYRAKASDLTGHGGRDTPHIHLEHLDPKTGNVLENWHLRW